MDSRADLERDIDNRLKRQLELIRDQFLILGDKVYKATKSEPLKIGREMQEECISSEARREEAENKCKELSVFALEYEEKEKEHDAIKKDLEYLYDRARSFKIRLGAILYERASLDLLDSECFKEVYSDCQKEQDLRKRSESKNPLDKLASQSGLQKLQRSANDRYIRYIDNALENDSVSKIGGNNAPMISQELMSILDRIKPLEEKKEELDSYLEDGRDEAQALKKGGLEEAKEYLKNVTKLYRENLISYGSYLFDKGGIWISESTPSDVLDSIENILNLQNEYAQINAEKQELQKASKADDYRALILEERQKIQLLLREKDNIDQEISEIESEIERLQALIDRLG